MQYTIGDVLTVIGFIVGINVSIWAMVVGFTLVFGRKAAAARVQIEKAPWKSLILGTALFILGMFFSTLLLRLQNPLTILMGWGVVAAMLWCAVMGGSGFALMMGTKIQQMDRRCSPFRGVTRGAGLMVLAGLLPLFGWVLAGLMLLASIGAGFQAILFSRRMPALAMDFSPTAQPAAAHAAPKADPMEFDV